MKTKTAQSTGAQRVCAVRQKLTSPWRVCAPRGRAFFGLLALMLAAAGVQAQSAITWGTPTAIAADTDVATNGTPVYAYTESGAAATVNGVSFAAGNSTTDLGGGNVTLSGFNGGVDTGGYIGSNPVGLSSAYQTVVQGGAWNWDGGSPLAATVTLNNLVSGRQYLVQFWVADYRTYAADRSETLDDGLGNVSGNLTYLTSTIGPTCGTYVTGTFTASGTTQTITVTPGGSSPSAQMNAIQVRDMTVYTNSSETLTWTAAVSTDWDQTTANWTNNGGFNTWFSSPTAPYSAIFDTTGAGTVNISASLGTLYASNLTFNAAGYDLSGSTLTLGNTPTIEANADVAISSILAGSGGLTKSGNGTLTLSGVNTYSGETTVSQGTLNLNLGGRSGTATFGSFSVSNSATLILDNTEATVGGYYPSSVVLSGAGTVTKTNTGSIDFWTGSSLTGFTGTMDVQQGALRLNNLGANGNMGQATLNIASGATFDLRYGSSLAVDKLTGSGTLDQSYNGGSGLSVTVGANNGSSTFGGVIQNASGQPMSLAKVGSGALVLSGVNTYSGGTTVSGGTLQLDSTTALPNAKPLSVAAGQVNLNYSGTILVSQLTLGGVNQPGGFYDATNTSTYFTGTGVIEVLPAGADQTLTWTAAVDGNWDSATANWTNGSGYNVWVNYPAFPASAIFNTLGGGGLVNLAQPITAGSVNMGDYSVNVPNYTLTNGSLTTASLMVRGWGNNGGNYVSNPTLTLAVPTVSVAGDLAAGRANLAVATGVVNVNRITAAPAGGDWGLVAINGGTVTATNGVDGSVVTTATFQLDLNGGAFYAPFIKVADRELGAGNSAWLNFNGTVVHPTVSTGTFITLYGGNQNTYVGNGGANFSTDGNDIGIGVNLVAAGTGGLTKSGAGTLTLTGANTWTGPTLVQGGVLSIGATTALGSGAVDITNGAVMDLNYFGQITVTGLTLNGVAQPNGTYGPTGSGATYINDTYFTGYGVLNVFTPPANQVLTWTGAVDGNWDEATANWTNGAAYNLWFNNAASPNSALFDGTGLAQSSVNVAFTSTLYASNLTFNAAGYSLSGNDLTLGNTPTLTVNSNATMANVLKGSGGLTKTGNGTLTLTGANSSYGGPLTVAAGMLEIGDGFDQSAAGGQVTVSNGATVLVTSSGNNALPFQNSTPAWAIAGTVNITGGGANTIPGAGVVLNNGTLAGTPANVAFGTFLSVQAANVTITANGSANAITSDNFAVSQTLTLNTPQAGDALTVSSGFFDAFAGAGSLAKSGLGTVTLSGASTNTGSLTVNAGTLLLNGSLASGSTISGGTLAGSGIIGGATTLGAGGNLAAGAALNGIGTLTINSNLTLNGNVLVNLMKGQAQSNSLFTVSGVLTNANAAATTLTVANLGPALAVSDKFNVFSKAVDGGASVTIVPPAGYTLSNNLAVDGSITVTSVPSTTPPTLSVAQSGSNLTFTWTGAGSLEWQTNSLSTGLGTNWVAYPNGTNGVTVTVDPSQPSVFFRVVR